MAILYVTGEIQPDATGEYELAGTYNGHDYYQMPDPFSGYWYIRFSDYYDTWAISYSLTSVSSASDYWLSDLGTLFGEYNPYPGSDSSEGTALVSGDGPSAPDPGAWVPAWPEFVVPIEPAAAYENSAILDLSFHAADAATWLPTWPDPPPAGVPAPGDVAAITEPTLLVGPPLDWLRPLDAPGPDLRSPIFDPPCAISDPGDFLEPDVVTLDKWLRPLAEPIPPTPPIPPGDFALGANPAHFTEPDVVTLDKWFQPLGEPRYTPPATPEAMFALAGELPGDLFEPEPVIDTWINAWPQPTPPEYFDSPQIPVREEHPIGVHRYYLDARGLYRVFNDAEYRFYRRLNQPPQIGVTAPFATSATLPTKPANPYGDGSWVLACTWFNGVLESDFLPIGPRGETYLRVRIDGGESIGVAPPGPADWRLEVRAGGVVRIHAVVYPWGADAPDAWAIAYATGGADPPEDAPDLVEAIPAGTLVAILQHDLPAQSHGTTVKVRLQTRRNDGDDATPDYAYSDESTVKTATADAEGPAAPATLEVYPGGEA